MLSIRDGVCNTRTQLSGLLHDIVDVDEEGIVVVHELGASRIDNKGAHRWDIDHSEFTESFKIKNEIFIIKFVDGSIQRHALRGA